MTAPNQLPDGVAPLVGGLAAEFAAIRHNVEEAARRSPPVITFPPPPPPPVQDTNFVRPENAMTLVTAFTAPWGNNGGGYANAAYSVVGTRVFLRGVVANSGAVGGPYAIFNLPVGFQPAAQEMFICTIGGGGAIRVDIYPVGNGAVAIGGGTSLPANSFLSLSGINFSTLA